MKESLDCDCGICSICSGTRRPNESHEESAIRNAPPPRIVGHQTLFELVAKNNCVGCVYAEYCVNCDNGNELCEIIQKVDLWKPLTEK